MTVAELLNDPSKWTREAYARNANGEAITARSPDAVCWCLTGALLRVFSTADTRYGSRDLQLAEAEEKLYEALRTEPDWEKYRADRRKDRDVFNLAAWNDAFGRTFADVRRLVEQAGV